MYVVVVIVAVGEEGAVVSRMRSLNAQLTVFSVQGRWGCSYECLASIFVSKAKLQRGWMMEKSGGMGFNVYSENEMGHESVWASLIARECTLI